MKQTVKIIETNVTVMEVDAATPYEAKVIATGIYTTPGMKSEACRIIMEDGNLDVKSLARK